MQGTNYVSVPQPPQYDGVQGRSVSTLDVTIPSGSTIVNGFYFHWTVEGGFTGVGWFVENYTDYKTPVTVTGQFENDDAVIQYLRGMTDPNLDTQFLAWQNYINELDESETGRGAYAATDFASFIQKQNLACVTSS